MKWIARNLFRTNFKKNIHIKYKVAYFDISKQKVALMLKGRSKTFSIDYEDLILDKEYINHIESIDACYIGGFYSQYIIQQNLSTLDLELKKNHLYEIDLTNVHEYRFKITGEKRDGSISYYDKLNDVEKNIYPEFLIKNLYMIENFSPNESCLIGIMAANRISKTTSSNMTNIERSTPPFVAIK